MAESELGKVRICYYCSSSISNFAKKLEQKLSLPKWQWEENSNDNVVFFGMYGVKDYQRLLYHKGKKKVFWCGGDITILCQKSEFTKWLIANSGAKHYCENSSEIMRLEEIGIDAEVRPLLFAQEPPLSYQYSEKPHVYLNCHPNRTTEYLFGLNLLANQNPDITFHIYGIEDDVRFMLPNIVFHGEISEAKFNEEIRKYQGGVRLNAIDGFSEIVAKSLLMGQPTFSSIGYEYTLKPQELGKLKDIKEPNTLQREYWKNKLDNNLDEIINNWDI